MKTHLIMALLFAGLIATASARSTSPSSRQATAPKPGKTITLIGCVRLDDTKTDLFTLSDDKTGATYRLSGTSVKAFVWRNVRIVGGLVPTPNIAAQAGAIDPTKAAMAYQGANPAGAGPPALLEFRVSTVRPAAGTCSPPKK